MSAAVVVGEGCTDCDEASGLGLLEGAAAAGEAEIVVVPMSCDCTVDWQEAPKAGE